jgi:hypothetical protein
MNRFALLCTAAFLSVCAPSFAAEDYVTLDRGKAFVAPDNKVQRFTQNINLDCHCTRIQMVANQFVDDELPYGSAVRRKEGIDR